jgi:hypothetical protein
MEWWKNEKPLLFKYSSNESLTSELRKNSSWEKKGIVFYLGGDQSPHQAMEC